MKTTSLLLALSLLAAFQPPPAQSQTAPSAAGLPPDLSPGAADVVKLAQSGVGDDVVMAYIKNSTARFSLSANNVLFLKSAGLSSQVLSSMLNHDTALRQRPGPAGDRSAPPANTATLAANPGASAPGSPAPAISTPPQPPSNVAPVPAMPRRPILVDQPPPPPQLELIPASPGPDYWWVRGHWWWRDGAWVWIGGTWVRRPGPDAIWMGGHWARQGHGYVWIHGRWHY